MNLLESYIKKIHSVTDVTEGFITSECYGVTERVKKMFWKSEFEKVKKDGYYMS